MRVSREIRAIRIVFFYFTSAGKYDSINLRL